MEKVSRLNSVIEAIKSSPFRVNKIFIQKDTKKSRIAEIIMAAKANHVPFLFVPRRTLDNLDRNHQGVIALLSEKVFATIESILDSTKLPFLVLLDGVEDPQNLGAIIRSAEGAGVDGIVIPGRRSAGLTEVVSSVSVGALEHVEIARVMNLARTMDDLRKRDIWLVGAEGGSKEYWYDFDYTLPIALVLGSEGKGLRPLISKKCDKILSIPLLGEMSSLNVAAAASIFFYEVVRQRNFRKNE